MIARGDRPIYRLQAAPDGRYVVEGCPWLTVASAAGRQDTADAARAAIAEWLGTGPDAFDVELR